MSPLLAGTDVASGSMELECIPPIVLEINLSVFPNNETLRFGFMGGEYGPAERPKKHRPLSLDAVWCTVPGNCEQAKATIIFNRFELDKKASGTYVVEFSDGHKKQGSFNVVRKKQRKPFLCE